MEITTKIYPESVIISCTHKGVTTNIATFYSTIEEAQNAFFKAYRSNRKVGENAKVKSAVIYGIDDSGIERCYVTLALIGEGSKQMLANLNLEWGSESGFIEKYRAKQVDMIALQSAGKDDNSVSGSWLR